MKNYLKKSWENLVHTNNSLKKLKSVWYECKYDCYYFLDKQLELHHEHFVICLSDFIGNIDEYQENTQSLKKMKRRNTMRNHWIILSSNSKDCINFYCLKK